MEAIDAAVVLAYLVSLLWLSARWGRQHRTDDDYYLGGRRLGSTALGLSVLATQSSTISFVSIPAFVAARPGGGLGWLTYELAVPLAMLVAGWALVPALRRRELVSVYEFAEQRYGAGARRSLSLVFLISRGLATAVAVYATALVLEACLGVDRGWAITLVVVLTVVYDMLGGMTAVVYSDVIQMAVLVVGLGACIVFAGSQVGGFEAAWAAFPADRRAGVDLSWGTAGEPMPLPAFLLGGLFLYVSYYAVDQSQSQRLLSSRSVAGSRRVLLLNGLLRFPLTLSYLALGIVAFSFQAQLGGGPADSLVPRLIGEVLPVGLRGLVFAALLAAGMSSLDSALNSLSAVTQRDMIVGWLGYAPRNPLWLGRLTTLGWGVFVGGFALLVERISPTAIEAINKVGSAFYGPVLAVFLQALRPARCGQGRLLFALALGVATNLLLWIAVPQLHWMWWNAIGLGLTAAFSWPMGVAARAVQQPAAQELDRPAVGFWLPLLVAFAVIAAVLAMLGR